MNSMNTLRGNRGLTNPEHYQIDGEIQHLDRDGDPIKRYFIKGAFPTTLSPIELAYATSDTMETFTVTLSYQWFETDLTEQEMK